VQPLPADAGTQGPALFVATARKVHGSTVRVGV
jgi:hypothetical protein